MNITWLCNEYPPHVYGGAGVHVEHLSRELARAEQDSHSIEIFCFGNQREIGTHLRVQGIGTAPALPFQDARHQRLLDSLYRNLVMTGLVKDADIIHCHTWYVHFAGCLLRELLGVPLVLTTHSLEPHRSWKKEQLGSGYQVSSWLEKTAYQNADGVIAVSHAMKEDVQTLYGVPPGKIRVIYNGIDTGFYKPAFSRETLSAYGINPDKPFLLFVGRITRQKGITHLVNAIPYLQPGVQIVLCAGAPDTEHIAQEMREKVAQARASTRNKIIWIPEIVPREHLVFFYSNAALFVCPSIYEPFGLINIEAMACGTPVVASAVGGIPEIVVHDHTGCLVPFEPTPVGFEPKEPEQFSADLAAAINQLLSSPERLRAMGAEARKRVEAHFSWQHIAAQTLAYYRELINDKRKREK
jgi:starch synthase